MIALAAALVVQDHALTTYELGGRRQIVTFQDVSGDGRADLMILVVDAASTPARRWIQVHVAGESLPWPAEPTWTLEVPDTASALIYGDYAPGPGAEPCYLTPDGVIARGPFDAGPVPVIQARTFFRRASPTALPVWSWGTDLDGNGRADLVLPTPDGYTVYLQTDPGRFGKVTALDAGRTADTAVRRQPLQPSLLTLERTLPRLWETDVDSNGTIDLVAFDGPRLRLYFQDPAAGFGPAAVARVPSLAVGGGPGVDTVASTEFADIDRDGNQDLLVVRVQGPPDALTSTLHLCFGSGYGIFREDSSLSFDGIARSPTLVDLDGDGCRDLVTQVTRADLKQEILSTLTGQVAVEYRLCRFQPERRTFERVSHQETLRVRRSAFGLGGPAAVERLEFRGDWTGDGRIDRTRLATDGALEIFAGIRRADGGIGFTPAPVAAYRLGRLPKQTHYGDYNADGRMDLLTEDDDSVGLLLSTKD